MSLISVEEFEGIENLDLSFSSLNKLSSIPTFCEYLKRDKALRSLNLNCCKLLNGDATSRLLRAVGGNHSSRIPPAIQLTVLFLSSEHNPSPSN